MLFRKQIFTDLAPNTEWDDAAFSLALLLAPWRWVKGRSGGKLVQWFRSFLGAGHAYPFASGRAALQAALEAFRLPADSEVLLQAYTCVAVPDAVVWAGLKPVYVDIDLSTFTMSLDDARKKISSRTRAVIIQHTFGCAADMDGLLELARSRNLAVIEDVAHALGSTFRGKPLGSFGDAAIMSFGRNKVVSSVFGGMLTTSRPELAKEVERMQAQLRPPATGWVVRQLLYAPLVSFVRFTYRWFGLGKLIMRVALASGFIVRAVRPLNRRKERDDLLRSSLANALAALALHQLKKLPRFMAHRRKIAALYRKELSGAPFKHPFEPRDREHGYLRYTVLSPQASVLLDKAAKAGIVLGDWYRTPIAPEGVPPEEIRYRKEETPVAASVAERSVNLPTDVHISERDARRIIRVLKTWHP